MEPKEAVPFLDTLWKKAKAVMVNVHDTTANPFNMISSSPEPEMSEHFNAIAKKMPPGETTEATQESPRKNVTSNKTSKSGVWDLFGTFALSVIFIFIFSLFYLGQGVSIWQKFVFSIIATTTTHTLFTIDVYNHSKHS